MWANMMNGQGWACMGAGMGIGMAIFWISILVLLVVLVGRVLGFGGRGNKRQQKTALDILRERYAAGEIQREEYEQKKHDLSG
jgi:putative membrane protein